MLNVVVWILAAGIVYGFNVTCPEAVTKLAKSTGVAIKRHNIIYRLLEDLRKELTLRLPALQVEQVLGQHPTRTTRVNLLGSTK